MTFIFGIAYPRSVNAIRLAALLLGLATVVTAQSGTFLDLSFYPVPGTGGTPIGITLGPDGAMWFAEYAAGGTGGEIGRITTAGTITQYPVTAFGGAAGITAGPDGALWFTEQNANQIGRITTSGIITEYPIAVGTEPQFITAGPDGALWFTVLNGPEIGRITTAGIITEYQIPTPGAGPQYITTGPDGALWFTEYDGNKIGRITTSGVITEYPTGAGPFGIAAGSDGALWYTEDLAIGRITTAGAITEYPVPGSTNGLLAITAGPDGALWFLEGSGRIARITTTGVITKFPISGSDLYPQSITAGPNGTLWLTESGFIGQAPACALGFSASFANSTLTMNFDLGIATPGTLDILIHTSTGVLTPYSKTGPPVVPPLAFTLNWSSFPNLGTITVAPRLVTPPSQVLCSEWTTVNTSQ